MDETKKNSFFLILPRKLIITSILLFFTSFSVHLIQMNSTSRLILAGNEMSHLALLYSIVHENSVEIKSFRGFDESYYKGKYYSNKPPGYSFFLTMPYWIFSRITNSKDINKTFIFTKLLNSFFSSLTFVMIYLFLSTFSKKQMLILLGLMAATLGTFFPAYNVLANSMPLSILLCIFALFFYRLFFLSNNNNAIYWSISLFCINYAVLTDYINGFLLFPLFIFLILKTKKKFILPGIISIMPLIILVIYNYLVFDNPFASSMGRYKQINVFRKYSKWFIRSFI